MTPRLNPMKQPPAGVHKLLDLTQTVAASGLDKSLLELVKIRSSQLNGCAYCLHMHTRDARAQGETEDRIYLLDGWREAPCYRDRERAALAWIESLTLVCDYSCAGSGLCRVEAAVLGGGASEPDAGHRHDQRLDRLAIGFRSAPEMGGSVGRG